MSDRCEFSTTKPLGAMSQSVRSGSRTRYARCKNRATQTLKIFEPSLAHPSYVREVHCCGLHARLFRERGFLP